MQGRRAGAASPRSAAASTHALLITDGFSCRSQIAHGTDRKALHLAQVVHMALGAGPNGPTAGKPEDHVADPPSPSRRPARSAVYASVGAGGLAGAAVLLRQARR